LTRALSQKRIVLVIRPRLIVLGEYHVVVAAGPSDPPPDMGDSL
jgi:hypothetical protein